MKGPRVVIEKFRRGNFMWMLYSGHSVVAISGAEWFEDHTTEQAARKSAKRVIDAIRGTVSVAYPKGTDIRWQTSPIPVYLRTEDGKLIRRRDI